MANGEPRVVVYTREGCHLCDVAIAVVEQICADRGEDFVTIDIDSVPSLQARYTADVPVISVDGVLIARWRVQPRELVKALKKPRGTHHDLPAQSRR